MKLTSKEMVILSVFLSIVIIVAGLFLFIMPEYEKIDTNKQSLVNAKAERDRIYDSLSREATIDQEIQDAIDQANTLSLCFYEDLTTYEADVIVREILDATNMKTYSLSLSNFSTSTLTVSDYIETVVSYPLKEYAGYAASAAGVDTSGIQYDEDGNIIVPDEFTADNVENALKEYLLAILSTQSQTIGAITVNFSVTGTRGDFLKFLDYVAGLERATYINSTSVAYTGINTSADDNNNNNNNNNNNDTNNDNANANDNAANNEGEEGEAAENTTPANNNNEPQQLTDSAVITSSISMTFYCVMPMQPQETSSTETAEPEPAE